MPTYDYKCPDCGNTETRLVREYDRDIQVCHKCPKLRPDSGSLQRLPSAPGFIIK